MSCDRVQLAISARMDGEPVDHRADALDEHVAGCERCRVFVAGAERVRATVRIRTAEPVPDLVSSIVGRLEALPQVREPARRPARTWGSPRRHRAMPVAAALVAGAVIGSVLVGGPFRGQDRDAISANAVVQGVRSASPALESFEGTFSVVERGLAPEVAMRRLDVHMAFLAPLRFRLDVVDRTIYPTGTENSWTPSDLTYIQDATTTFRSGPTGCPAGLGEVACPPTRTTLTSGSTPTDLMVPVATFGSATGVRVLGTDRVDGAELVRLELTFARAQAMLPFLWLGDIAGSVGAGDLAGAWRPFFPGDRVEVQLDADGWVPRRITVFPASTERRRAWELRFGRPVEDPSVPILEVVSTEVATTPPDASLFKMPRATPPNTPPITPASPTAPAVAPNVAELAGQIGYRPATPTYTGGLRLTSSIAPLAGPASPRSLLVYADGLDYLRVGEHPGEGAGARRGLVGHLGTGLTRVVPMSNGGVAYHSEATGDHPSRLVILGDDTSLVLETNLPRLDLFAIASSIPVQGRPLP